MIQYFASVFQHAINIELDNMIMTLEGIHRSLFGNHFRGTHHVFDESSVDIDQHCEEFIHQLISALESPHMIISGLLLNEHKERV